MTSSFDVFSSQCLHGKFFCLLLLSSMQMSEPDRWAEWMWSLSREWCGKLLAAKPRQLLVLCSAFAIFRSQWLLLDSLLGQSDRLPDKDPGD